MLISKGLCSTDGSVKIWYICPWKASCYKNHAQKKQKPTGCTGNKWNLGYNTQKCHQWRFKEIGTFKNMTVQFYSCQMAKKYVKTYTVFTQINTVLCFWRDLKFAYKNEHRCGSLLLWSHWGKIFWNQKKSCVPEVNGCDWFHEDVVSWSSWQMFKVCSYLHFVCSYAAYFSWVWFSAFT